MAERLCVLCRTHPVDARWRPFCSERCKLLDLARWADGSYRVAGEPASRPEDEDKPKTPKTPKPPEPPESKTDT